ncbi:MAG: VWA domain-containing protein [Campylobacterota bacterium]|nr:VWA domain-containing protein [Campylobacterota bacterium]
MMTLLYPHFLWLILPLLLLLWRVQLDFIQRIHIIVLILLTLSLSRPVEEKVLQEATVQAKDIIIALDVSYSMKATDITPTRYDFAKETIALLLDENPNDNVMLLAFTTNPLLLSPPTTDHRLIKIAIKALNPEFILTKGTSLETLFQQLLNINSHHKNMILITDGGEEKNVEILKTLVQRSGVSLTILALGTTEGTTIVKNNAEMLKDKEGNLVISRINPLLKDLASSVLGNYIEASHTAASTAQEITKALQNLNAHTELIQKKQHLYLERYQIPLSIAALLFLMLHTRAVKYLLFLFTFMGIQTHASVFDGHTLHLAYQSYQHGDFNDTMLYLKRIKVPSLQSQIALGNTYYKQNKFKKAIQTYTSIQSTSTSVKQQLYYNIANAYALQEAYDKAKIYYTKALQLKEDEDTRHNLNAIVFLNDKKDAQLGIAHPKSQNSTSSKSDSQGEGKKEAKSEDQPSSGSGGESKTTKEQKKNKLIADDTEERHPLSSKVYELINKGYIREKQPW